LLRAGVLEGTSAFFMTLFASYERALEAGGVSVDEPKRKEGDPARRGGVKDPAGNTWSIATQVA
jgi:uncharacterized glyoxalase superfamily protein PhnB